MAYILELNVNDNVLLTNGEYRGYIARVMSYDINKGMYADKWYPNGLELAVSLPNGAYRIVMCSPDDVIILKKENKERLLKVQENKIITLQKEYSEISDKISYLYKEMLIIKEL